MRKKTYDTRCYDLAEVFLSDEPKINTKANRDFLAHAIQDAIESTIRYDFGSDALAETVGSK